MKVKSYTDLNQSQKLAKILPIESADMWFANGVVVARHSVDEPDDIKSVMPCWSLAALLSVISIATLECTKGLYHCVSYDGKDFIFSKTTDNPIDTCVEMILKLHELKMLF